MIMNKMCILNIPWKTKQKKPRSLEHPPPCGQDTKSAYDAHYALMGKWPWCYTSTGQDGSKELDLELLSSSICKIPRAFIMPMSMAIMPPWVNDIDVAHL